MYVNVTVPAETGVITPAFVTVATFVLLVVQVPKVVGVNKAVDPIQTDEGAETTGKAFTVTFEVVFEHPVAVTVYVKLTVPGLTPVTTPVADTTVAVPVALLVHVPKVLGLRLIVLPTQTEEDAVSEGSGFTVNECSLKQPEVVSVYLKVVV